jgi:hypothetical protein
VIRHTALFVWSDDATDEDKVRAKDGVAYCYFGSDVLTLDFGEHIGPAATRHGFALQHDHRGQADWQAYNENAAHHRAGAFLRSVTRPELAARVDWVYDGPASTRGSIRHLGLYRWRPDAGELERTAARAAVAELGGLCGTMRALEIGSDLGWYPPNYDWIVEAHFDDLEGLAEFMEHPARVETDALLSTATQAELTACVQYRMLSG